MLQSMWLQRVGHDLVIEQKQQKYTLVTTHTHRHTHKHTQWNKKSSELSPRLLKSSALFLTEIENTILGFMNIN